MTIKIIGLLLLTAAVSFLVGLFVGGKNYKRVNNLRLEAEAELERLKGKVTK